MPNIRIRILFLLRLMLGLKFLQPRLRFAAFLMLGMFVGLGLLLAHVSRATSYMVDSPETCMNCHVMTDAYVSWKHSSHSRQTTCNGCHVPHTSLQREYTFKAQDGLRHAGVFALRMEPQSIKLSHGAVSVVQENCVHCHEQRVSEVSACRLVENDFRCWDCHREVVHGRQHGLSASPDTFRPDLPSIMPQWLPNR